MRIFIDADSCDFIDGILEVAKENDTECVLVHDTSHDFGEGDFKDVLVDKGLNSADQKILSMIEKRDIVITQDIPLATMCCVRGAKALDISGFEYNDSIVYNRLCGIARLNRNGHRKAITQQDRKNFTERLWKLLNDEVLGEREDVVKNRFGITQ